jgi:streptogramin lyase
VLLPVKKRLAIVAIVVLLVGAIGAAAFVVESRSTSSTRTTSTSAPGACSAVSGVFRTTLSSQSFGEVTTYRLPKPLLAPNSIVAAPDGSVWFGEVSLRGVAHLYVNGTLVEYPWPSSFYSSAAVCYDLEQLWGVVLWKGMVWASDHTNDQLVGLVPSNDTFRTIKLESGYSPRFLAIDPSGNLWFTTSGTPAQIGVVDSATDSVSYFSVPAAAGEFAASLLFYNSSLAYVVAVSATDNLGQVLSFDPLSPGSTFQQVGGNQTLLGPYSAAAADGGLWVGEHDASDLAFFNQTSSQWSFYPTSLNPEVPLTLPYYLLSNGTGVWFNEHDSNKVAEIYGGGSSLTEYNVSDSSIKSGIGNLLTIGLDHNLVWFTEWTGNEVGFVNASMAPGFSISSAASSTMNDIEQGSSAQFQLTVSGSSSASLAMQFSDSESHTSVPVDISFQTNSGSISGLSGSRTVELTVSVSAATPPGRYLLLATVTDSLTYSSVYIPVVVTGS